MEGSIIIVNKNHEKLCQSMFNVLNCNSLWVMNVNAKVLNLLVTDNSIVEHYWRKKYYLQDPNIRIRSNRSASNSKTPWRISLGTTCKEFNKNGFLYDLYKLFHIEEFVSIEKITGKDRLCFRFFTKNNRFIFANKLLNDMPIIKHFIDAMIPKFKMELNQHPGINLKEEK